MAKSKKSNIEVISNEELGVYLRATSSSINNNKDKGSKRNLRRPVVDGKFYTEYELFKDTTFSSRFGKIISTIFKNNFFYDGLTESQIKNLDEIDFRAKLIRIASSLILYRLHFTQIVPENGKLKDIRTYDVPLMDFLVNDKNDIIGYAQLLTETSKLGDANVDMTGPILADGIRRPYYNTLDTNKTTVQYFAFSTDYMFHSVMTPMDSSLFPYTPIDTIYSAVRIKQLCLQFYYKYFEDGLYQDMFTTEKKINEADETKLFQDLKKLKHSRFTILKGVDLNYVSGSGKEKLLDTIKNIMNRCDDEIDKSLDYLVSTNDDKGNKEVDYNLVFADSIKYFQNTLSDISKKIFSMLNWNGKIIFPVWNNVERRDLITSIVALASASAKPDKLAIWARSQGLDLPNDFFNEMQENTLQNKFEKNNPNDSSRQKANFQAQNIQDSGSRNSDSGNRTKSVQ